MDGVAEVQVLEVWEPLKPLELNFDDPPARGSELHDMTTDKRWVLGFAWSPMPWGWTNPATANAEDDITWD